MKMTDEKGQSVCSYETKTRSGATEAQIRQMIWSIYFAVMFESLTQEDTQQPNE
jgi:hypothetical protein